MSVLLRCCAAAGRDVVRKVAVVFSAIFYAPAPAELCAVETKVVLTRLGPQGSVFHTHTQQMRAHRYSNHSRMLLSRVYCLRNIYKVHYSTRMCKGMLPAAFLPHAQTQSCAVLHTAHNVISCSDKDRSRQTHTHAHAPRWLMLTHTYTYQAGEHAAAALLLLRREATASRSKCSRRQKEREYEGCYINSCA